MFYSFLKNWIIDVCCFVEFPIPLANNVPSKLAAALSKEVAGGGSPVGEEEEEGDGIEGFVLFEFLFIWMVLFK